MRSLVFSYRFESHDIPVTIFSNQGSLCAGLTPVSIIEALGILPRHRARVIAKTLGWIRKNLVECVDYWSVPAAHQKRTLVLTPEGIRRLVPSLEKYLSRVPNDAYLRAVTLRGKVPELIRAVELAQMSVRLEQRLPYQAVS